ncbi:SERTA domain-containing protein 3, partial [Marasmius crinis-equi]
MAMEDDTENEMDAPSPPENNPNTHTSSLHSAPAPTSPNSGSRNATPPPTANATTPEQTDSAAAAQTSNSQPEEPAEQEDDDDVEAVSTKKEWKRGSRGNPGIWKPEQVAYFETKLDEYRSTSGNARSDFIKDLMPEYLEKFPESEYPYVPTGREQEDPGVGMTEESVKAMDGRDRKAYHKRVKRYNRNDQERHRDSIKGWFKHRVRKNNTTTDSPFEAPLRAIKKSKGKAPQRPGLPQFVAGAEEFREEVLAVSKETDDTDRLPCRVSAASKLISQWTEEKVEKAKEMLEEEFVEKCESYSSVMIPKDSKEINLEDEIQKTKCRRALAGIVEPFLNFVRAQTGMAVFFQAGIELDHPDRGRAFDVVSLSSVPEGHPSFAKFNLPFFRDALSKEFANWLRTIKRRQIEEGFEFPDYIDQEETSGPSQQQPTRGKKTAEMLNASAGEVRKDKGGKAVETEPSSAVQKKPRRSSARKKAPSASAVKPTSSTYSDPPAQSSSELPKRPVIDPNLPFLDRHALSLQWNKELAEARGIQPAAGTPLSDSQGPRQLSRNDDDEYEFGSDDDGSGAEDVPLATTRRYSTRASKAAAIQSNDDAQNRNASDDQGLDPSLEDTPDGSDRDKSPIAPPQSPPNSTPIIGTDDEPAPVPLTDITTNNVDERPTDENHVQNSRIEPEQPPASTLAPTVEKVVSEVLTDVEMAAVDKVADGIVEMNVDRVQSTKIDDLSKMIDDICIPELHQAPYPLEASDSGFVRDYGKWLMNGSQAESGIWMSVVYRWIELEELLEKLEDEPWAMRIDKRPEQFKRWFKDGRVSRPGGIPTPAGITLPDFRETWCEWWNSILQDDSAVLGIPRDEDEAEPFCCRGKDGFVLILVALKWWFA